MRTLYIVTAALGLVTAVYYGLPFWLSPEAGPSEFLRQASANAVARTLNADLAIVYVASCIWMVHEGRRLKMPHVWLYIVGNTLVAVAFGLGLFMVFRHSRIHNPELGA